MAKNTIIPLNRLYARLRRAAPYAAGALGMIYLVIHGRDAANQWPHLAGLLRPSDPWLWIVSLLLAAGNWLLRIAQWKTAAEYYHPLGWKDAACQQLKSFAWSAFTPASGGEWPGKRWFYRNPRGILRAVSHQQFVQMGVTLAAGIVALQPAWWFWGSVAGVPLVLRIRQVPARKVRYWLQLTALALLRYLIFAGMLVWLLHRLHPHLPVAVVAPEVGLYYLWSSLVPLAFVWDLPVKGSVGLWQFGALGYSAVEVAAVVLWMWIWNTLLPVTAGQVLLWTRKNCGYV